MVLEFGDIYLVNFDPSVGMEYKKVRPALVVQRGLISTKSPYVTVMPISSKIENLFGPDIFIPKDRLNRLMTNSVIKVRQISSFDKRRFLKRIGRIGSPTMRQVRGYLRRHFGL
ncbi:type II toxin-antitoxin system PemK/MazF family toxin [Candidatus Peregrinibacteria bacterium]|nr:type II toxin-antitoxin system PemK/MazF family toxin [Candidatus Peregrinibacteria bacterium]